MSGFVGTTYELVPSDIHEIEAHDKMPIPVMCNIISTTWDWRFICLRVFNVIVDGKGTPYGFQTMNFSTIDLEDKEKFMEFMAGLSLTHKLMFVDNNGSVFVTESNDGQTNIDADMIDMMVSSVFKNDNET